MRLKRKQGILPNDEEGDGILPYSLKTDNRRKSDKIEDNRKYNYWPGWGKVDTTPHMKPLSWDERGAGMLASFIDQAGFGYGDNALAYLVSGLNDTKYEEELERAKDLQIRVRDQLPTANILLRGLGMYGPGMIGAKVAQKGAPMVENILKNSPVYGSRSLLGLLGLGATGVGYHVDANRPRRLKRKIK